MTILDAAFWAVCLVVVASGATKLADPRPFAGALVALGSGGAAAHVSTGAGEVSGWSRVAALVVGVAEVVLGLTALVLGGSPVAWAITGAYAGFTVVVLLARRRGLASCGCFGARSGPPSGTHAVLNAASALVAAAAAVRGPLPLADGLDALAVPVAVLVVVAVLASAAVVVVVDTR